MLLVSTIHDPTGKLAQAARKMFPFLSTVYEGMIFCVTEKTHRDTIKALEGSAVINLARGAANGRRCALSLGLETKHKAFHYCDGDRILFWACRYPYELRNIVRKFNHTERMVILGRTKEAMDSHPLFQRITEHAINILAARGIDYLTGSRIIPADIAEKILEHSISSNVAALDVEWPRIAGDFIYAQVDGLAYEHRLFGLEKPLSKEIPMRLQNMISAIRAQWQNVK